MRSDPGRVRWCQELAKKLLTRPKRNLRPSLLRGEGIDDLGVSGLERFELLFSYYCAVVGVFHNIDREPPQLYMRDF